MHLHPPQLPESEAFYLKPIISLDTEKKICQSHPAFKHTFPTFQVKTSKLTRFESNDRLQSASRRRRWRVRTWSIHHPSAAQTTSWKLSTSLCTWVQQYLTASPLRSRSTGASGKPPLLSQATANSPSTLRSRCTLPVYWAPYFTAVNHGPCVWGKKEDSTPSTCTAWGTSWASPGEKSTQQHSAGEGRNHLHVHHTQAETIALARPCLLYGGLPYPQGPSLWRTGNWRGADWETQQHFKDIGKHDLKALAINIRHLGGACMWQVCLETEGSKGSFLVWRHPDSEGSGKKGPAECSSPRQTGQPKHSAVRSAVETVTPASGS